MIELKVYDGTENGVKGKHVDITLEGEKLDIIAEFILAVKKFIDGHLNASERFAFLKVLIDET